MKARIPINNRLTNKQRETVREYAAEEYRKQADQMNRRACTVFILAAACVLHTVFKFGAGRLLKFMDELTKFYQWLGGYDDAAGFKCIQILEDVGLDMTWWKKELRGENCAAD